MKHYLQSHTIEKDYKIMAPDEFEEKYAVELDSDGSVWDPVDYMVFSNITSWISHVTATSDDEHGGRINITKPKHYDDGM